MIWFRIRFGLYKWKGIDGILIPVHMHFGYPVLRFIANNQYEKNEISVIKKTLTKHDIVLELGTGIGFVSAYCAKQIGNNKVFTYEANVSLEPLIMKLYKKNNVKPTVNFAVLGDKNDTINFYKDELSFLASSLHVSAGGQQITINVEEKNLNEIIAQLQPTYLIMDIEGGEYEIFKIISFQSIKKIQFELHPDILNREQVNFIFGKLDSEQFIKDQTLSGKDHFYFYKNNK